MYEYDDEYCEIGDIENIPSLSDYSDVNGYLMNYTTLYNIANIMNENNIKYIKAWGCMYTTDEIRSTQKKIYKLRPQQLVLYIEGNTIVNVYDIRNGKTILLYDKGDLLFISQLYICGNECACIDNYNKQIFESIETFKREIEYLETQLNKYSKVILDSEKEFINTDIVMEALKRIKGEI